MMTPAQLAAGMATPVLLAAIPVAIGARDYQAVEAYRAEWARRRDLHPNRCAQHMDDAADTCPCYAAAFRVDAQVATGNLSAYRSPDDDPEAPQPEYEPWVFIDEEAWDADAAHERWLETRYEDEP